MQSHRVLHAAVNPSDSSSPEIKVFPQAWPSKLTRHSLRVIGLAWSPGNSGKTSISAWWGMF